MAYPIKSPVNAGLGLKQGQCPTVIGFWCYKLARLIASLIGSSTL